MIFEFLLSFFTFFWIFSALNIIFYMKDWLEEYRNFHLAAIDKF